MCERPCMWTVSCGVFPLWGALCKQRAGNNLLLEHQSIYHFRSGFLNHIWFHVGLIGANTKAQIFRCVVNKLLSNGVPGHERAIRKVPTSLGFFFMSFGRKRRWANGENLSSVHVFSLGVNFTNVKKSFYSVTTSKEDLRSAEKTPC